MIKAVIFDCFGVLTSDFWKEFVASLPMAQQEPARELNRALDRGQMTQKQFAEQIYALTGNEPQRIEGLINSDMQKNARLLSYIKELSQSHKLGILSNISTNWIREKFLSQQEIDLFDDILLSYEVGMVKPDPGIFRLAAKRLAVEPDECIFIDDGEGNCQAAEMVGMHAVLYKDTIQCKQAIDGLLTKQS